MLWKDSRTFCVGRFSFKRFKFASSSALRSSLCREIRWFMLSSVRVLAASGIRNASLLLLSRSAALCRSMIIEIIVDRRRVSSCRHSKIIKKDYNNSFNGKYNELIVIMQRETVARNSPFVNYYIQVKYFLTVLFSLLFKTILVKLLKNEIFFSSIFVYILCSYTRCSPMVFYSIYSCIETVEFSAFVTHVNSFATNMRTLYVRVYLKLFAWWNSHKSHWVGVCQYVQKQITNIIAVSVRVGKIQTK